MSRFPIYEDSCILIDGEMFEGKVFIHSEYKPDNFSKSVYKQLLEIWIEVMEALKEKGLEYVFSCIPKEEKIMKWQTMFGMSPLLETDDNIIYRRAL